MKRGLAVLACALVLAHAETAVGQVGAARELGVGRSVGVFIDHAFETGWPLSLIQTLSMERLVIEVTTGVWHGGSWYLEYPVSVLPLTLVRHNPLTPSIRADHGWVVTAGGPRATSYGAGIHPLGLRGGWGGGRVALFGGASLGLIMFNKSTPGSNTSHVNFSGDLGVGVGVALVRGIEVVGGYQFNHVSNAGFGEENPGIDSHMIRFGLRKR